MVGSSGNIGGQIIDAFTSGFTGLVTYIPNTISTGFQNLFVDSNGNLTVFVYVCLVFGGIALVMGLLYLVYNLIAKKIGA